MAIVAGDIEWRYSGGTTNTDPAASLGGAMSTQASGVIDTGVKNDLFDDVSSAEASAGDTEYRGIYIKNNHGSLTFQDCRVYHSADSASSSDVVDIAIADEGVSTTIETIANENTAPTGPSFSHPTTYAGGIALNSTTGLAAAAYRGLWVRRTISASAPSGSITNTLRVEGLTA
jgi:hypothetical protein